jgi:hypothetical protein
MMLGAISNKLIFLSRICRERKRVFRSADLRESRIESRFLEGGKNGIQGFHELWYFTMRVSVAHVLVGIVAMSELPSKGFCKWELEGSLLRE